MGAPNAIMKRSYQRRPGLITAVRMLGASYSHARRVIVGERQSKTLLARLRQLQDEQRAQQQAAQTKTEHQTPTH